MPVQTLHRLHIYCVHHYDSVVRSVGDQTIVAPTQHIIPSNSHVTLCKTTFHTKWFHFIEGYFDTQLLISLLHGHQWTPLPVIVFKRYIINSSSYQEKDWKSRNYKGMQLQKDFLKGFSALEYCPCTNDTLYTRCQLCELTLLLYRFCKLKLLLLSISKYKLFKYFPICSTGVPLIRTLLIRNPACQREKCYKCC